MKTTITIFLLAGVMLSAACSSKNKAEKETEVSTQVKGVRPAASGGNSAAYFTYENTLDNADTLLSVKTSFAGMSQVHESYKTEDGMMGMKESEVIVVEPGEKISFQQGGLHIMLMNLKEELITGDSVVVELHFSQAGVISEKLPVLP